MVIWGGDFISEVPLYMYLLAKDAVALAASPARGSYPQMTAPAAAAAARPPPPPPPLLRRRNLTSRIPPLRWA